MLGQGMLILGPIAAGSAALVAIRTATDRGFAIAAMSITALEVLALVGLLAMAVV
ncbi:MAG: hypothetical protein HZA53_11125 [Planctomycetes bacterium]|nr:hypothetical protein [Planctomycetota bacterium]